jgi:voltage-gated potassium channel
MDGGFRAARPSALCEKAHPGGTVRESDVIYRQLWRSLMLVIAIVLVGVVGYTIIGWGEYSLLDAIYMTVITLTTVGYSEVIDLSGHPLGRVFTVVLLVSGVGAFLSFVSSLTAFWVDGHSRQLFWRRRMERTVARTTDHIIVCGGGHTGAHVVRELVETERAFVLIETDPHRAMALQEELGREVPTVVGDATDDDALLEAGIERATTLVSCVSNDKDNLIVTVSARILNPTLRIVCRCVDERVTAKIRKAGADAVVSPNRIGGLRMISEAVRPVAVAYLDRMLRDQGRTGLRVESTEIGATSALATGTIADLLAVRNLHLLAVQNASDGGWNDSPEPGTALHPGDQLVYTGGPEARREIERLAGA